MKTPKQKADELVDKFKLFASYYDWEVSTDEINYNNAKKCAIILCDNTINTLMSMKCFYDVMEVVDTVKYWQEVKTELLK